MSVHPLFRSTLDARSCGITDMMMSYANVRYKEVIGLKYMQHTYNVTRATIVVSRKAKVLRILRVCL